MEKETDAAGGERGILFFKRSLLLSAKSNLGIFKFSPIPLPEERRVVFLRGRIGW